MPWKNEKLLTVVLFSSGLTLALYSYFALSSIPLTALGIGILATSVSIASTYPFTPYREAVQSVLYSYTANISRILEEFSANSPALYTPSGYILVPLKAKGKLLLKNLNGENLIHSDSSGYYLVLQSPVSTYAIESGTSLEVALAEVIVNSLGLSDGVRAVIRDDTIIVEFTSPRSFKEGMRFRKVLGPLPVHISLAVAAITLDLPLQLGEVRENDKKKVIAELKVYEHAPQG